MPLIALVAIFGKQNEPIVLRNYLYDFLAASVETRSVQKEPIQKETATEGSTNESSINEPSELGVESQVDYAMIKQKRMLDITNTRM